MNIHTKVPKLHQAATGKTQNPIIQKQRISFSIQQCFHDRVQTRPDLRQKKKFYLHTWNESKKSQYSQKRSFIAIICREWWIFFCPFQASLSKRQNFLQRSECLSTNRYRLSKVFSIALVHFKLIDLLNKLLRFPRNLKCDRRQLAGQFTEFIGTLDFFSLGYDERQAIRRIC